MMFFRLFFLFFFQNQTKNLFNLLTKKNSNTFPEKKNNLGNDERYKNKTEIDYYQLYLIQKNMENKKLLDILENKNISIHTKLYLINRNNTTNNTGIKPFNINAGNLMKDW
jgi:hypothetical protein